MILKVYEFCLASKLQRSEESVNHGRSDGMKKSRWVEEKGSEDPSRDAQAGSRSRKPSRQSVGPFDDRSVQEALRNDKTHREV